MDIADYDAVYELMRATPGVSVRDADSRLSTERYLLRNPGLSFVAVDSDELIGCVMAGHDGRRGYLNHLIVRTSHRSQGTGGALVDRCIAGLEREGILKTHIDVIKDNVSAQAFWAGRGWALRTDIDRYSFIRSGGANV